MSIASSTASGYRGEYKKWEDWVRTDQGRGSGADPEMRDLTEDSVKARFVAEYIVSLYVRPSDSSLWAGSLYVSWRIGYSGTA